MKRTVAIRNAHPRLRFVPREVAQVIHLLDSEFRKSPLARGGATRRGVSAVPHGELSLVFLTDPALARIHGDFMDDPTATDVITFEGDPAAGLAGEICVSADTAMQFVEGPGLSGPRLAAPRPARGPERFDFAHHPEPVDGLVERRTRALQAAFAAELTLYVVHGWLHLAGYDDLQPAKKRRMRAAEARAMKLLRAAKAVPGFRFG